MPPKTATNGKFMIYLTIDNVKYEIKPSVVWVSNKLIKKQKRIFRICQVLRYWRLRNKNYYPKQKFLRCLLWCGKVVQE